MPNEANVVTRWAVILAGGVGSRFWPLSTPTRPKQLLPLVSDVSMLEDTLARMAPLVPSERTLILTNESLVPAVSAVAKLLPESVIAEPRPAGTAAALAWAAREIERRDGPDAVMLSVHADWAVANAEEFRRALQVAEQAAIRHQALVTIGIVPSRPDPGFGYIQPGDELEGGMRKVARFVEKPSREVAQQMCDRGFLWNSGIFVWRVGDFLSELREHCPEVAPALEAAKGDAARFFAAVKPVAVDVGVLERSNRVLVIPGDFGWDDVGTWASLHRVRAHDANENALTGDVYVRDAAGNVVHSDDATVVLYGVSDLVVVVRDGLVLVTTRDRSADLKALVDGLPSSLKDRP